VEASVHPLTVIEVFADVAQVFQHKDWLLEPASVLDGPSRRLFNDVSECMLVVVESFINPPLGGVTLLEPFQRREHLFAKVPSATTIDEQWVSRRVLLAGTAREQMGFTNIESDWCYVVVCRFVVRVFDRELDGDVERPRRAVALQAELPRRR
jgi:hypothetical protein